VSIEGSAFSKPEQTTENCCIFHFSLDMRLVNGAARLVIYLAKSVAQKYSWPHALRIWPSAAHLTKCGAFGKLTNRATHLAKCAD